MGSRDVASAAEGTVVAFATSHHEDYGPNNILNR